MKPANCIPKLALSFTLVAFSISAAGQDVSLLLSPSMALAIEKVIPGASLVTLADIDAKSCGTLPKSPGLVRGDFNGDKRSDFSVLLKAGETGKSVSWQGSTLKQMRYAFVIFLDDGKGGFRAKLLQRFINYAPIAAYIDRQPAGMVRNRDENRNVSIRNEATAFVFCEKSASVYYVKANKVHEIPVTD